MRRRWQVLIALVPAGILCAMSMLTFALPTIVSPLYALAAIAGTVGLAWAIFGAEEKHRWIVVPLLVVGVVAVSFRLLLPSLDAFTGRSSLRPICPIEIVELLLSIWIVVG